LFVYLSVVTKLVAVGYCEKETRLLLIMLIMLLHVWLHQLNWLHYINNMLSVTEYQVDMSELVLVYEIDFIGKISKLVNATQHLPTGNR